MMFLLRDAVWYTMTSKVPALTSSYGECITHVFTTQAAVFVPINEFQRTEFEAHTRTGYSVGSVVVEVEYYCYTAVVVAVVVVEIIVVSVGSVLAVTLLVLLSHHQHCSFKTTAYLVPRLWASSSVTPCFRRWQLCSMLTGDGIGTFMLARAHTSWHSLKRTRSAAPTNWPSDGHVRRY